MSNNGRADIVGPPIELGDFLPERREVKLNGNLYDAWVTTNHRYPRSVMVKLDRAARAYNRVIDPLLPEEQRISLLTEGSELDAARLRAIEEQPSAWADYVQEAIRLLVPGTQESELELVDTDSLHNLGQQLGYFPPDIQAPSEVTEPEGEASQLTGATSLPDSGVSIQEPIPTSN